jgi:hypothetical protein
MQSSFLLLAPIVQDTVLFCLNALQLRGLWCRPAILRGSGAGKRCCFSRHVLFKFRTAFLKDGPADCTSTAGMPNRSGVVEGAWIAG